MEKSQGFDFLFCDICGAMLSFSSHKYANCSSCGFKRSAREMAGREICYKVTAEDFRRDLNKLEPFIAVDGAMNFEIEVQRKVSEVECTVCKKANYEYYELQTRSADEGMTVFYECPNPDCRHKYKQNN